MGYVTLFTDDLARADENPWTDGGVLDAGTTLQYTGPVAQANLRLVSNKIHMAATSDTQDAITRVNNLVLAANQWAMCRLATVAGAANSVAICMLRVSLADTFVNAYQVMALMVAGGVSSLIYKRVAGAGTQLATTSTGTWAAGDVLRATAFGSQITALKNEVIFLTVSDATYPSNPSAGWALSLPAVATVTDLEIDSIAAGQYDPEGVVFPRVLQRRRRGLPIPFLR